jgi:MoxR-like ATPase
MNNMISFEKAVISIKDGLADATHGLVERKILGDLIVLSAVAGEHLLVVGPPGTAKSEAVRRVAQMMGGRYFEYLLGRYTEPSEIFGPVDLRKLRDGTVETETTGMLPEADIVFLDEVFLGSTAILNTLLGILNERYFRRGHTRMRCPLRVCVGATNRIPEDESLAAFADRFLIHHFVESVPDQLLEHLLDGGWYLSHKKINQISSLEHLDVLSTAAKNSDPAGIRLELTHCIRLLRKAGIALTDRRLVKLQYLIASAAVLAGRKNPCSSDLWPIIYAISTAEGQVLGQEVLRDILEASENETLPAATEAASLGPRARATRILSTGKELLSGRPETRESETAWMLELEALAREIDAGFSENHMTEDLKKFRQRLVHILSEENNQKN